MYRLLFITVFFVTQMEQDYTVPTEVIDVSTFNSTTTIDTNTQNALGGSQSNATGKNPTEAEAVTAVRVTVFAGQDDTAGGSSLVFCGYPGPTNLGGGVNTAQQPQTTPCLNGEPDVNCSLFVGANGQLGCITMQFKSSLPTTRYKLIPTGIQVPYAYLDHHPTGILYCMPDQGPEGDSQHCSMGPAMYVSYDNHPLLNPFLQNLGSNPDPTVACRGVNNQNLGTYVWYQDDKKQDFITPGCFACPIQVATPQPNKLLTTVPHFCSIPAGLPPTVPTFDDSEMTHSGGRCTGWTTSDAASLYPYYYWCFGLNNGYNSDLSTQVPPTAKNVFNNGGVWAGYFLDMIAEYDNAYRCTLSQDAGGTDWSQCVPYTNVVNAINHGSVNCNIGEYSKQNCNASVLQQVEAAVSFLTASCDAVDTQESQSGTTFSTEGEDPNGFYCPGSRWTHVRPNVFIPPEGFSFARCSAGCSDHSTVTHSDIPTKNTNRYVKNYAVSSVMSEKGTIEVGPVMCDVYRVQSQPRATIDLEITIIAPDGTEAPLHLSTDGLSFETVDLQGVNFSARINRIETTAGGVGETLDGYIVICGTTDNIEAATGGRDVSICTELSDPTYNIADQFSCSVDPGILRGVFPEADGTEIPTKNPWSDIIQKATSDFYAECTRNAPSCADLIASNSVSQAATARQNSCAVPTPMYLAALNCGRRVSWYYVEEFDTQNYGTECGRLGYRNAQVSSTGGAQFVCQQGDFTCTPGFGTPRYGSSAANTRVKSPCQEQGALTGFQMQTAETPGTCGGVPNMPPGWTYGIAQDFTPGGNTGSGVQNVPNMWVHRGYLYRQPTTGEATEMSLDVEIYTNTFFGGEYVSYTAGIINQTNPVYCGTTVSESQSGSLNILICNTNPSYGGGYSAITECHMPETYDYYQENDGLSITMYTNPVSLDLGPGQCNYSSWDFGVSGPVDVTQVYCISTLYSGTQGGIGPPLSQVEFSCEVSIPTFIDLGKHKYIPQSLVYKCPKYDLFCQLSEEGAWEQDMIYFLIIFLFIIVFLFTVEVVRFTLSVRSTDKKYQDYAKHIIMKKEVEETTSNKQIPKKETPE